MSETRALKIVGWLAMVLCGLIAVKAVDAKTLEQRDIGDWQVVALADDAGSPTVCYAVGAITNDGQAVSVEVDKQFQWYLTIYNDAWELSADAERDLTYAIDGGSPTTATARGFGGKMMRIALGGSFDTTEPLRRGNRIEIRYKKGGGASFSLRGSSNALDALLTCATRHLDYRDDPDIASIGAWLALRKPNEDGSCRAATAGADDIMFFFSFDRDWGYFLRIAHRKDQWHLRDGEKYVLTYQIDGGTPVETYAGASANSVLVLLGKDATSLEPFESGRVLLVQAERQSLSVDLRDAAQAFAVLQACAKALKAQSAAVADPFSSTTGGSTVPASTGIPEEVMPTALPPMSGQKDRVFVPESIGAWDITAADDFDGGFLDCTIFAPLNAGDPSVMFHLDRDRQWKMTFTDTNWKMVSGQPARLRAIVDGHEPVMLEGTSLGHEMIGVTLGEEPPFAADLRNGHRVTFEIEQGRFELDLTGAGPAFRALEHCTAELSTTSAPAAQPIRSTTTEIAEVDRTIAVVSQLRMTRVIFDHEPLAERELRERLRVVLSGVPDGEKMARGLSETQAFLAEHLEKAMKSAPSDVLAKLIRHQRDVMIQLQSRPDLCAAFFKANGRGDFSYLPVVLRLAQGEIYADLIEAAATRPDLEPMMGDQELGAAMAQAYLAQGFSTDDFGKLAELETLDARETCRLGTEFSTALAALPDDKAGDIFRAGILSSP